MQDQLFEPVQPEARTVRLDTIAPWEGTGRNVTAKAITALGMASTPLLQVQVGSQYHYRVIDGRRRLSAAKESGIEEVTAMVLPADVPKAETLALTAVSNMARTASPLDEADALGGLIGQGYDVPGLAKLLGLSQATINKRLKLLELPATLYLAVHEGNLRVGVASRIANLRPEQIKALEERLETLGKLTGKDVAEVQQAHKQDALNALPDALFEPYSPPTALARVREAVKLALLEGYNPADIRQVLNEEVEPCLPQPQV